MGYLFVALALLCGVTKGYCGKKTSGSVEKLSDAMLVNTVRMLMCIFVGLAIVTFQLDFKSLTASPLLIAISALSGVSTAVFTVSWLMSVRQGAYMMVDVFLLMGVLLPILLCNFIYNEAIHYIQWIGIAVLLVAGYIMCTYNAQIKGKMSFKAFVLLLLCALSNGTTDFSQKLFSKELPNGNAATFNLYTYLFAGITLAVCYLIFRKTEKTADGEDGKTVKQVVFPIVGYVVVMAICLFLNSFFKTMAAGYLDATQIYPLSQGGSVILSMLMSSVLFGEKINVRCIVGVALSFVALIMINVLPKLI